MAQIHIVASSSMPLTAISVSSTPLSAVSDIDRSALMAIIQGIPHGTIIRYSVINDLYSSTNTNKTFNVVTLISLILSEYMNDNDWNFLVIGSDERILELNDCTEVVYGVICLGEAIECFGSYGDNETLFQQANTGEVREIHTPSHHCTIHVTPSAIVF
eukprot:5989236-Heterocapsa_arctica.AAC.1